jgi:outer membrane receptor protein involved in Fe transport
MSGRRRAFHTFARWRCIDRMTDARYQDFRVPSRNYLDLGGYVALQSGTPRGLTASVGVDNATDTDPPISQSYSLADTDPSICEVLGRRLYVDLG